MIPKRSASGALLLLVALNATAAVGDPVPELDLSYRVIAHGRDLGLVDVDLTATDHGYQIRAVTRPQGIAKLLGGDVTETFRFDPVAGGTWTPIAYEEVREGRKEGVTSYAFEVGSELLAQSKVEGEQRYPAGSTVEPQAFPLASVMLRADALDAHRVLTPNKRGIREYVYTDLGTERIEIDGTGYDTRKWLKQRPEKDEQGIHIWIDDTTGIPVRMEKFKDGDIVTMDLAAAPR